MEKYLLNGAHHIALSPGFRIPERKICFSTNTHSGLVKHSFPHFDTCEIGAR
jgi:hypothetical protein